MSISPLTRLRSRKKAPKKSVADRRVAPDRKTALGPLRWIKGALRRPLGLERRDGHLKLVLVERRRAPPEDDPLSIPQLRKELRERLLSHELDQAATVMRHLVFVHDELGRKGWLGVEALPARTIGQALVQAEMLDSQETSPSLTMLIERLRVVKVAADLRDERKSQFKAGTQDDSPLVTEASHEEFEAMQRSWADSVPTSPEPPVPPVPPEPDK